MRLEINDATSSKNTVVTNEFKGVIEFTLDENGMVVDGDKTITHQELYDATKEEVIDERLATDSLEDGSDLDTQETY